MQFWLIYSSSIREHLQAEFKYDISDIFRVRIFQCTWYAWSLLSYFCYNIYASQKRRHTALLHCFFEQKLCWQVRLTPRSSSGWGRCVVFLGKTLILQSFSSYQVVSLGTSTFHAISLWNCSSFNKIQLFIAAPQKPLGRLPKPDFDTRR